MGDDHVFNVSFFAKNGQSKSSACQGPPEVASRACRVKSGCSFEGLSFPYKAASVGDSSNSTKARVFDVYGFLLNSDNTLLDHPTRTRRCLDPHFHYPNCGPSEGPQAVLVWTSDADTQCNETSQECQSLFSVQFKPDIQIFVADLHRDACVNNTVMHVEFWHLFQSYKVEYNYDDGAFLYRLQFYDEKGCQQETLKRRGDYCQQGKLCKIEWNDMATLYWGIGVGSTFCKDPQFIAPFCVSTTIPSSSWWSQYWYVVAAACGGGLFVIGLVTIIVCCCIRRKSKARLNPEYHLVHSVA